MKPLLLIVITLFFQTTFAQQITLKEWNEQALTNIRLLPKYGNKEKTDGQKEADKEFIETTLAKDTSHRKASDHLIELGFKYLYRDVKTAMYRFNQAYLLDSTNSDIYWGFAAVYMVLQDYKKAEKQYQEGLLVNPKSTHLLTDYGTYFIVQHYNLRSTDVTGAMSNLNTAIDYMKKSYQLDSKDPNTAFKLSAAYFENGDCANAWKFYDECKALGGQPITDDYTKDLTEQCKRN